jgi:hypothetical protein
MSFQNGLATYEIFKTGLSSFLLTICLCFVIGLVIHNATLDYTHASGTIVSNLDMTQTLKYNVDNNEYIKKIDPINKNINGVNTYSYAHIEGTVDVYYTKKNPNIYSIGINPTNLYMIFTGILGVMLILIAAYLYFLNTHRDAASVLGGISIVSSILPRN